MKNFAIRLILNAAALSAAAHFVSGISLTGSLWDILVVALIFGLVNALLKPIVFFFSLPFILVTLGLFTFVVNGLMLLVTAALSSHLAVSGLWAAIWGSLVISVVSWLLGSLLKDERKKDHA
ncbi:MAG: phage holin family protein [Gemmatimonadetes bacterium]|nr:phage holin family protein [Gemmatimonadota bacterium]